MNPSATPLPLVDLIVSNPKNVRATLDLFVREFGFKTEKPIDEYSDLERVRLLKKALHDDGSLDQDAIRGRHVQLFGNRRARDPLLTPPALGDIDHLGSHLIHTYHSALNLLLGYALAENDPFVIQVCELALNVDSKNLARALDGGTA